MKHLLITLTAVCFILVGSFNSFSQTTKSSSKKLVKCYEKGKVVYRTKCKTKKSQSVAKKSEPYEKYGNPSSKYDIASDGTGSGGGQGVGSGRGQGSGSGSGSGAGTGNNTGQTIPEPPITNNSGTTPLKILSKPRMEYTDEARTNQVQGTVTLRVTFLANGTIGSITPVSGLPDGLTEQATKAAKLIKFEPATKNGKPITVTKQVQYNFTLY